METIIGKSRNKLLDLRGKLDYDRNINTTWIVDKNRVKLHPVEIKFSNQKCI